MDIRPKWLKIARRLQSAVAKSNGVAIVSLTIVVDKDGDPSYWPSPAVTLIEPRSESDQILEALSKPR